MNDDFNIADLFFDAAKRNPFKTAIIYKQSAVSFSAFEKQVTDTARHFINKGIGKGDRVLVFVPMSIDLYCIVLALFRTGATAVFLDEWVSKKRMEECCKIAQCKAFIGILKLRVLAFFSIELRKVPIWLGTTYSKTNLDNSFPVTTKEDTALITFTTGSTGTPKAAKRTHGFLYNQFKALEHEMKPGSNDITMTVLPIVLLINLASGTTSVIADFKGSKPNALRPQKIIRQLKKYSVTGIIASPFFVKQISEYVIFKRITLPQLKTIFTGGAPVFPSEAEVYDKAFPDAKIKVVYGSTEAEPISLVTVKTLVQENADVFKGLNVGNISDCAEVKIINITDDAIRLHSEDELSAIELQPKEVGEIIVSGDHVLREYFNNEKALRRNKIFAGSKCWHRTGDSGYLDSETLFLTGRCNTLIRKGNDTLYPFLYENHFQAMEEVEMGTVLMANNKIVAAVELKDKLKKDVVKSKILSLKQPFDEIVFIKKIPRDPRHNSKIDYENLKLLLH